MSRNRSNVALGFQKTNFVNGWFARICSWFLPVLVGHVSGSSVLFMHRGRSERLFAEYHEKLLIEQIAWRFYRRRFQGGRGRMLLYRGAGLELDYASLLLKATADEAITLAGIRLLARKAGLHRTAYLGKMLWPKTGRSESRVPRLVAAIHAILTWCDELIGASARLAVQLGRIVLALVSPRRDGRGINTLWFGIMPNELGRYGKNKSFYWPSRLASPLSILYVLFRPAGAPLKRMLESENIRVVSQFHILTFCRKVRLLILGLRLGSAASQVLFSFEGSWTFRARLCAMHFDAIAWDEFARAVPVRLALTTPSNWTSTRPMLIALKAAGARTALWHYSANVIPLQHPRGRAYFNGRTRTVHEAERIYVWNEHVAGWHRENLCHHPCNEVVAVGPVMCGDARLCFGKAPDSKEGLHIAVFDVSLPRGSLKKLVGMPNLPAAYHEVFWSDIARLLKAFPEIVLIVKTKRSIRSKIHAFTRAFWNLIEDPALRNSGRIELIDDDADPYLAIAKADVVISMPFTSPTLAAWHFGKTGIFHDSMGIVGPHRFQSMGRYFSRSYESLASLIAELQENKRKGIKPVVPPEMACFIGRQPMENPQEAFLRDLTAWVFPHLKTKFAPEGRWASVPEAVVA